MLRIPKWHAFQGAVKGEVMDRGCRELHTPAKILNLR